jgi:hypothetical protein
LWYGRERVNSIPDDGAGRRPQGADEFSGVDDDRCSASKGRAGTAGKAIKDAVI